MLIKKVDENHLIVSHAQSVDLGDEIVGAWRARLQSLCQLALSCRQDKAVYLAVIRTCLLSVKLKAGWNVCVNNNSDRNLLTQPDCFSANKHSVIQKGEHWFITLIGYFLCSLSNIVLWLCYIAGFWLWFMCNIVGLWLNFSTICFGLFSSADEASDGMGGAWVWLVRHRFWYHREGVVSSFVSV